MSLSAQHLNDSMFDDDDNDILSSCLVDVPALTETKKRKKNNDSTWIMPSFDDFSSSERFGTLKKHAKDTYKCSTRKKQMESCKQLQVKNKVISQTSKQSDNCDLWVDRHKPHTQLELAVHKKKVAEVQDFLQRVFSKKDKQGSILLLTGPCGAGKTATVQVLAEEMSIEIQEWINPISEVYKADTSWQQTVYESSSVGGKRYESQASLFQDFILRANRYPSLQIFSQVQFKHRLILVEDFPNIFFKNTDLFHKLLRDYHACGKCPIIFILSDSAGGDSSERLLFPKDLQVELAITNISFNPVAPTSLVKVLTQIVSTESTMSNGRVKVPPRSLIDNLASASTGDIRGAINALQFACLKDTRDLDDLIVSQLEPTLKKSSRTSGKTGAKCITSSKKQTTTRTKIHDSDRNLAAIGGRDTSLFLFRALGKILYCKRADPASGNTPKLPAHLSQHHRNPLAFNPEDVIDRCQLSGEFLMAYLHQNYLDFYSKLDDVVMAADYFTEADMLTTGWANRSLLCHYAASIAVRGVMFSNSARASSASLGWKPLHKPDSFEVKRRVHNNKENGRYLFRGYSWTSQELYISFIPYLKLINPPLKEVGQVSFIQEINKFERKIITRLKSKCLDEKDVTIEDIEDNSSANQQNVSKLKDEYVGPVDDDEVVIEDYDD